MDNLLLRYKSICVFNSAKAAVAPLAELAICDDVNIAVELAARVFSAVAESGCDTTGEWINTLIISDDNVFSRAVASGERVATRLKTQVVSELNVFKQLSLVKPDRFLTGVAAEYFPRFGFGGMSLTYERLVAFYSANGCGRMALGSSFAYKDGELYPTDYAHITLDDLKNYVEEKAEIVRNTENFIAGLPAFHALLYGDRGTGKSATVRAIANDYRDKLKVIELGVSDIDKISELRAELAGLKQKFILFIDDLVLDGENGKMPFESILDMPCGNTLIYCTSNRKPTVNEVERSADIRSELALFDRFGLVITYMTPSKDEFVDILKQILRSRAVKWHDEYSAIAELAAFKRGGRSPRAAKQIADLIESNYAEKRSG